MFTDQFLLALGEWQNGWGTNQMLKKQIEQRFVNACQTLNDKFRVAKGTYFRKRFIHPEELKPFLCRQLSEGAVSWTGDPKFAENFRGTLRPDVLFGAIFECNLHEDAVLINIPALWQDEEFIAAVNEYSSRKGKYGDAILGIADTQKEVVINTTILPENIYAISGRSSEFSKFCDEMGAVSEAQEDELWKILVEGNLQPEEPRWIGKEAALQVFSRILDRSDGIFDRLK